MTSDVQPATPEFIQQATLVNAHRANEHIERIRAQQQHTRNLSIAIAIGLAVGAVAAAIAFALVRSNRSVVDK